MEQRRQPSLNDFAALRSHQLLNLLEKIQRIVVQDLIDVLADHRVVEEIVELTEQSKYAADNE